MEKVAKWTGILWMVGVAAYFGVIGTIESEEGRALIFPAWGGIGEGFLQTACLMPGFLLYRWGARRVDRTKVR